MVFRDKTKDGTTRLTGGSPTSGEVGPPGPQGNPGPKGDKGDPGESGISSINFSFTTPSTSWICVHNFGTRYVDVSTVDTNNNDITGDVEYLDVNTVRVSWYFPVSGTAVIQR